MGKTPKVPPPPPPTAEETALMQKQTQAIDQYMKSIDAQNLDNAQAKRITEIASGLYDPVIDANGNLTGTTLNQDRLKTFQADSSTNQQIAQLSAERYMKALKGELPVSEGTTYRKGEDFRLLKENAARKGIQISGDTPEGATSNSTSGNELVKNFNTQYGLIQDSERQGAIGAGYISPGSNQLNLVGASTTMGPGASAAGYGNAVGLLGQAQIPYANQRGLQYQTSVQNTLNRAQTRSDYAGLLGRGAGYAAMAAI